MHAPKHLRFAKLPSFVFGQVFQVARRAGFAPEGVQLQHVPFGLVQGAVLRYLATAALTVH